MKRWSLPRRRLPEADDKNTKSSTASSMHMSPMVNLFHRGIQRVGSHILMQRMFVWDLMIVASHRPPRKPNFNIDCNHIRQHWYGGSYCRLLRRWGSEDMSLACTYNHIPQNTVICNNLFKSLTLQMATWRHVPTDTHDVIITSLLRQNDAVARFERNNNVIIMSHVR